MGNSFLGRTIVNGARQQALQERLMGAMAPRQSHRAHGALLQERGTTGKASARTLRVSGRTVSAAGNRRWIRSEEHTSELQSLMRISYAVFCLKKKKHKQKYTNITLTKHY